MNKGMYFLALGLCLLYLSSCAAVGAIVTITAFGVEGYEEVRTHKPELKLEPISKYLRLPNIDLLSKHTSDQNHIKADKNKTTTKLDMNTSTFGFDCSKLKGQTKQSKCFNDFSKALAQKDNEATKQTKNLTTEKNKKLSKARKATKAFKKYSLKPVNKSPLKYCFDSEFVFFYSES